MLGGLVKDSILGLEHMQTGEERDVDDSKKDSPASTNSDTHIRWFSELKNTDVAVAGGKGASLGEMFQHSFPVPPGFVITAQAYDHFIDRNDIRERIKDMIASITLEDTEELTKVSKQIRELIESKEFPREFENEILEAYHILGSEKIDEKAISGDALHILKHSQEPIFVSVRSSATTEDLVDASFAGQQESFLNVKGDRSLITHVRRCFSSLYTPRAIYYRAQKGFKDAAIAVVVQKMVDSEKSGVIFSRDPVNLNDTIVVEAVYGLGEGIVSGKILPDHYVASRDLKVKSVKTSDKKIAIVRSGSGENTVVRLSPERSQSQVLSNGQVLEAANYALRLEEHYHKPQDIEFAIEGEHFYILQSRPITTSYEKNPRPQKISGTVVLKGLNASPGIASGTVRIISDMDDLSRIKKGDVLVTEMTNPDMVVSMQKSAAIITDEGGITSHASIVSREMGIPAVVGTGNATKILKDGMQVTVDGSEGVIYEGVVAETHTIEIKKAEPTERVLLKVIVDLPEASERAAQSGLDSVGLLRLEGIIASSGEHPLKFEKENTLEAYTQLLEEGIEKILSHFSQAWIRASDIRTDEYATLEGAPEKEVNPMLGFHGVRFSLKHPRLLDAELLAIKNVSKKNPEKHIGVMFPQIISIEEVLEVKKFFEKHKTENMSFGVMIETPAAVQIIEDICKEVQFISFGTNDLTQFTLGVDRGNEDVQYLYDEFHPAMFSQIKRVIGACRRHKVETSICGQAGSNKDMVTFLFKKGIDSISVNADAAYDISLLLQDLEKDWEKDKIRDSSKEWIEKREVEKEVPVFNKARDETIQREETPIESVEEEDSFSRKKRKRNRKRNRRKKWLEAQSQGALVHDAQTQKSQNSEAPTQNDGLLLSSDSHEQKDLSAEEVISDVSGEELSLDENLGTYVPGDDEKDSPPTKSYDFE